MSLRFCQVIFAIFTELKMFKTRKKISRNCVHANCKVIKNLMIIVINFTYSVDFHLSPSSADTAASMSAIRGCCWDRGGSGSSVIGQMCPVLISDWLVGACRPARGDPSVTISHSTNTDSASMSGPRLHQQSGATATGQRGRESRILHVEGLSICNNEF